MPPPFDSVLLTPARRTRGTQGTVDGSTSTLSPILLSLRSSSRMKRAERMGRREGAHNLAPITQTLEPFAPIAEDSCRLVP
jgi:hypothetical protein